MFGDLIPSQTKDRYWIDIEKPGAQWSGNPGKWLLFIPAPRIDTVWRLIRSETLSSKLGIAAKVATAMKSSLATSQRVKLICVYTYSADDLDDVRRVRQRLRGLGFTKKLPYKTDAATRAGKYISQGDSKVSMFYE
jgi:hypothetical protein